MTAARLSVPGPRVPRTGGAVSRLTGQLMLRVLGWRVTGGFPDTAKAVVIVAPHTSNWDFPVGVAAKLSLRLRVTFLGKHTLFAFPLGILMRALGGMPVDRTRSNELVSGMAAEFEQRDALYLVIAPEGTRKKVERWRTGFYHIAHSARVPIVPVALNWGAKEVQIQPPFETTGDVERDIAVLQQRFAGIRGRGAV